MKTTFIGKSAENRVAKFLRAQGFKVLNQNWRTKVCEIDIIASKNEIICFVEVKYRSSDKQGEGMEYITFKKIQQMQFAAEIWNQQNNWEGDWRLLAASVSDKKIDLVELD
jgi:uncharacterized protein (TIGR00252 family)